MCKHTEFIGNQTCFKVKPYFPQGFKSGRRKSSSGCSPFCQLSVITENLFTKCSQCMFQEFKTYFIGSSGHWKILYSFPKWFGALLWHALRTYTPGQPPRLSWHSEGNLEAFWMVSSVECFPMYEAWKQPFRVRDGEMSLRIRERRKTEAQGRKEKELRICSFGSEFNKVKDLSHDSHPLWLTWSQISCQPWE